MNEATVFLAPDQEATEAIGKSLARDLIGGDIVLLEGALAAGKTTLVRGLVRGLEGREIDVSSPTFVIAQTYPCRGPVAAVHHIDLYRLPCDPGTLREIGIEEFLADDRAVVAVEWPRDLLSDWLPTGCRIWRVQISRQDDDSRRIEVFSPGRS